MDDTTNLPLSEPDFKSLTDLTEEISCPVCGSQEYSIILKENYPQGLTKKQLLEVYRSSSDNLLMDQLVSCKGCTLVYLSPRIKSNIILESYASVSDSVFFKQNPFRIKTFKRNLLAIIKKFKINQEHSTKVLDIGCAGGAFPKAAHDLGLDPVGIEPSKWLCEEGQRRYGLDLKAGILQDYEFPDGSFNLITMWDVIEHVTNPSEVLLEIHRILDKDGYLLVNYPNHASIARRLFGKKWPFFLSVHLYYFTPKTITLMLKQCGFEVIESKPYWQTLELGYIFARASTYFKLFGGFEKLAKLLKIYHLPLTYNMGQTRVVSKKINANS
jgi:ubiquinone/menaquinone biosynthesis C-methylase UbiE